MIRRTVLGLIVAATAAAAAAAFANGGPFRVYYPTGDPSARGVQARIDPGLHPRRETRLRVLKEDLSIDYGSPNPNRPDTPSLLLNVNAHYTIQNPTDKDITVDFGFPIMRAERGFAEVYVDRGTVVPCETIYQEKIYSAIRKEAYRTIEKSISLDPALRKLTRAVRSAGNAGRAKAKAALVDHLIRTRRWNNRDAALLAEYPTFSVGPETDLTLVKRDAAGRLWTTDYLRIAIGEQKATQYLTQLAHCLDRKFAASYEGLFKEWGGDVRERSLDVETDKLRPREYTVPKKEGLTQSDSDPTVYARVDCLNATFPKMPAEHKATFACILKNLPVVFTFAPMSLLHYRVSFPHGSTRVVQVHYGQLTYSDTRSPATEQFAYVLHPASKWKYFGPIKLAVTVPWGARLYASTPIENTGSRMTSRLRTADGKPVRVAIYRGEVKSRTGEMFLAVRADDLKKAHEAIQARRP